MREGKLIQGRELNIRAISNFFYLPGTIVGALIADKCVPHVSRREASDLSVDIIVFSASTPRLGPKRCLILGLLCQSAIGFILSGVYNKLKEHIAGFAILYGLYLSFGELGPGNNLGLVSALSRVL